MEITLDYIMKSSLEKKIIKIGEEYREIDNDFEYYKYIINEQENITSMSNISYFRLIGDFFNCNQVKECKKVEKIIRNLNLNKINL